MEYNDEKDHKIIELGNRIKGAVERSGKNQVEFASLLGIHPPNLTRWIQGGSAPAYENLVKIGKLSGVSFNWLMTGEGDIENTPSRVTDVTVPWKLSSEFVFVGQVSGKIGAGGGLIPDNAIEMRIAFRRDWIQRKGSPENMSLIRVAGDSMEPTLHFGDIVLIDHSRDYVDPHGGIYAIVMDEQIVLKRLQVLYPERKIKMISDNSRYQPSEIEPDQIKINGKVIWFGRELE